MRVRSLVLALALGVTSCAQCGRTPTVPVPEAVVPPLPFALGLALNDATTSRELVGRLRGSDEDDVRVPKRAANSFIAGESAGAAICSQTAGTGVNEKDREPQPRYGDAAPNRGNCASQVLVTDAVTAPTR